VKAGERVHVRVNLWYDKDHRILSTNYHTGHIVPAGTEVMITEITNRIIRFEVAENKNPYFILNVKRHSMNATTKDLMDMLFSNENPVGPGTLFDRFTEEEKRNIRFGTLEEGMSRDAVLMAYGYPPRHQTSSLKNHIWVYWDTRWSKKMLYFEDDRVFMVAGSEDR